MKRLQVKVPVFKRKQRGEITVFLSLIFILIMSLVTALIESASIRLVKNLRRVDLSMALESVFAEYDKELFDNYHVFAIDGGYGTGEFSYDMILDRLAFYGADVTENQVSASELLTDGAGLAFYQMAILYEKERTGLSLLPETKLEFWQENENQNEQYQKEQDDVLSQITGKLDEAGEELPKEDNPIAFVGEWKKQGVLSLLLGGETELSNKVVDVQGLSTHRDLRKGIGEISGAQGSTGVVAKALFGNYILKHFSNFANQDEDRKLTYEIEYILGGQGSDKENLECVLNKLLMIRFPINYVYLLQDEAKKMEAEAMAAGLCSLLTVPGITTLVKHAILLAWAYGESVVDIRTLAGGKKVPTVKTQETWNLQLSSLANLGNTSDSGKESETGMDYGEYLRILLLLEKEETLCMRALDLIENELETPADAYVTGIGVKATCSIRKGVNCKFEASHRYQ